MSHLKTCHRKKGEKMRLLNTSESGVSTHALLSCCYLDFTYILCICMYKFIYKDHYLKIYLYSVVRR